MSLKDGQKQCAEIMFPNPPFKKSSTAILELVSNLCTSHRSNLNLDENKNERRTVHVHRLMTLIFVQHIVFLLHSSSFI